MCPNGKMVGMVEESSKSPSLGKGENIQEKEEAKE